MIGQIRPLIDHRHPTSWLRNGYLTTDGEDKAQLQQILRKAGDTIGLLNQEAEAWFKWTPAAQSGGLDDAEIESLIVERNEAKQAKNYQRADEIRQQLKDQGIVLEDSKDGTRWSRG